MKKMWLIRIIVILVLIGFVYLLISLKEEKSLGYCNSDSECAPASCCHPNSCVVKEQAPDCVGVMCSQVCEPGTLDCNQGSCVCKNNRCATTLEKSSIANPASVYCEENGGTIEIKTDAKGGQYGICILANGIECEEWEYFRGRC